MAYDLLIKNGRVVDGSGGPSFRADVAIKDGKIVGVGKFSESATRTINADGRVVAQGSLITIPTTTRRLYTIPCAVPRRRMATQR